MNIFYNNDTLYVNMEQNLDVPNMEKLKKRVFNILNDYDIGNIVLNIISNNKDNYLLDGFIKECRDKYDGNLIIK